MKTRSLVPGVLGMFAASVAFAHPHLESSTPASGAVQKQVSEIRLVFSEVIETSLSSIRLEAGDEERAYVTPSAEPDKANSKALLLKPFEPLPTGKYVVRWTAVGSDGHPARGSFSFIVSK